MAGEKILVIDDNNGVRMLCKYILEHEKFRVQTRETAGEGVEELANNKYDLVLLDIQLPDMMGTEALPQIKAKYPDLNVMMISGYGDMKVVMDCLKNGAFDYIAKPFSRDYLVSSVRRCLEKKEPIEKISEYDNLNYLFEISRAMKEPMDMDKLGKLIISAGLDTLKADSGSLMLVDEKTRELEIRVTLGLQKERISTKRIKIGEGISGIVAKEKHPLLFTNNYNENPEFTRNEPRPDIKSAVIVPLIQENRLMGILSINNIISDRVFTDQDLKLMTIFAKDCAKAISKSLSGKAAEGG